MTDIEKQNRAVITIDLDIFVLKPTELLVLPDTPNIYLTQEKAQKLLADLQETINTSKDGIIIKLDGKINPRLKHEDEDESMFLTRELKASRVREMHPDGITPTEEDVHGKSFK
ncbi:MAG TPA: hypothetical protein ENN55_02290 [Firmicutes bacterium]|nr:hypothetical protein [Bacillota bacterium]